MQEWRSSGRCQHWAPLRCRIAAATWPPRLGLKHTAAPGPSQGCWQHTTASERLMGRCHPPCVFAAVVRCTRHGSIALASALQVLHAQQHCLQPGTARPVAPGSRCRSPPLVWNAALAAQAQDWANQCIFAHSRKPADSAPNLVGSRNLRSALSLLKFEGSPVRHCILLPC